MDIQEELRNDLTKIDNAIAMEHATYQGASLKNFERNIRKVQSKCFEIHLQSIWVQRWMGNVGKLRKWNQTQLLWDAQRIQPLRNCQFD